MRPTIGKAFILTDIYGFVANHHGRGQTGYVFHGAIALFPGFIFQRQHYTFKHLEMRVLPPRIGG